MHSRIAWVVGMTSGVAIGGSAANAANFEWTNPLDGLFFDQNKWTLVGGAGVPPPEQGDTVLFNEAGQYTITFNVGGVTRSDVLQVTDGIVTFVRSSQAGGASYSLTTGNADALIHNAQLRLGLNLVPINLNVGDVTNVLGPFSVAYGSGFNTTNLTIASSIAPSGNGSLNVSGSTSSFNVTGTNAVNIGQFGSGNISVYIDATGSINGPLFIGTSTGFFSSGSGTVSVATGAQLTTNSIAVGGGTGTQGALNVLESNATLTMGGASTLTVGGPVGNGVGTVDVNGIAFLNTGAGLFRVNPTGSVVIADNGDGLPGGTINVNGDLQIDGGEFLILPTGTVNFAANRHASIENGGLLDFDAATILNQNLTVDVRTAGQLQLDGGTLGDGTDVEISIADADSLIQTTNPVSVGKNGATGSIEITDQADGDFATLILGSDMTPNSTARLIVSDWNSRCETNTLNVVGLGPSTLSEIRVSQVGASFYVNSPFGMTIGDAAAQGSSVVSVINGATFFKGSGGATNIRNTGVLFVDDVSILFSDSNLTVHSGGALRVDGDLILSQPTVFTNMQAGHVSGSGTILKGAGVPADMTNNGTIAPGDSAGQLTIDSELLNGPTSIHEIEIGGPIAGSQFDQLVVNRTLILDGELHVALINGFAPSPGTYFHVVDTNQPPMQGQYASTSLPPGFSVTYEFDGVFVLANCPGNIVADGAIDIFDLLAVLGNWGTPLADVTGDGLTDVFDLVTVLNAFGGPCI